MKRKPCVLHQCWLWAVLLPALTPCCVGERFESATETLSSTTDDGVSSQHLTNTTLDPRSTTSRDTQSVTSVQSEAVQSEGPSGVSSPDAATTDAAAVGNTDEETSDAGGSPAPDADMAELDTDDELSSEATTDEEQSSTGSPAESSSNSDTDDGTQSSENSSTDGSDDETASDNPTPPECADDELLGTEDHCYFFSSAELEWQAARDACFERGEGWALAAINSDNEHQWVSGQLETEAWIGGFKTNGNWVWVNTEAIFWHGNAEGEAVDNAFSQWEETEPSAEDDIDQCVRYSDDTGNWLWADMLCTRKYLYICER